MIASPVGVKWTSDNVAELFTAEEAELQDVLYAEAVSDYLQSLQNALAAPAPRRGTASTVDDGGAASTENTANQVRSVLSYINAHSSTLFDLLQGKGDGAGVVQSGSAIAAADAKGSQHSGSGGESDPLSNSPDQVGAEAASHENGASSVAGSSKPLRKENGLSNGTALSHKDAGDAEDSGAEAREIHALVNVTELLSFCIAQSTEQADVGEVVAACTTALSVSRTLEAPRAFAVQRLLLEAFDSDFESTTQGIADSLTPAIIAGVVENLASNSIVAETLIALFGSALSAVWMVKPTTKTALFTSRWIELEFPAVLCAFLPIAIRDPGMYHYFYFFKELLKRGYSHSAGPIVDVLLGDPLVSRYVASILECCERDVGRSPLYTPEGAAAAPVSLAADGVEVLVSVVSLVRKSLVLPETSSMYSASTQYITPLRVMEREAQRLTRLLAPVPQHGFGPLRLAVCELFVELSLFQLAAMDRLLVDCGFFPAFIRCCERFPQHDALARSLHRCVLAIFKRPTLCGESLSDAADRDVLWKYFVRPGTVALSSGGTYSVIGAITQLAEMPGTSVSSHCIDVLMTLAALPLFQAGANPQLAAQLSGFRASESIQERVLNRTTPITGKDFEKPGSAALQPLVHRDTINLAGDRFRGSRTGIGGRNGRLSGAARKSSKEAYIIVRHSADEDRPQRAAADAKVDIAALKQEVKDLQDAGSPQIRSYPSFSSMHLGFFAGPEGQSDDKPAKSESKPEVKKPQRA